MSSVPGVGASTMPSQECFFCSIGGGVHEDRMRPRAGTFMPMMPICLQMGIIGMKVPARGRILSSWTPPPMEQKKHSWEGMVLAPTPGTLDMRQAMYYALSLPISTVIIGCDSVAQLEHNVQLAREFTPFNEKQMASLVQKAEPVSKQALFFRFYDHA